MMRLFKSLVVVYVLYPVLHEFFANFERHCLAAFALYFPFSFSVYIEHGRIIVCNILKTNLDNVHNVSKS